jgi:hypothetical protein
MSEHERRHPRSCDIEVGLIAENYCSRIRSRAMKLHAFVSF